MKVPIQNLYYLFCYAWRFLPDELAIDVGTVGHDDVLNLCAHVLVTGIDRLLRRGIDQGYLEIAEETSRLRGRVNLTETVSKLSWVNARLSSQFDELSPDVLHNRILRTTVRFLATAPIDSVLRDQLRETDARLSGIKLISVTGSVFRRTQIHRNNNFYGFLMRVCELVYSSLLPDRSGDKPSWFRDVLSDEKYMAAVFEEFIRNFYDFKQSEFSVSRTHPQWNATAANDGDLSLLPTMTTDATLVSKNRTIIIDAKYYADALQTNYDSRTVHSENLYQLLAYLRGTTRKDDSHKIEGLLIYPVGKASVDLSFTVEGYPVRIYTLDLGRRADEVEANLLELIRPKQGAESFLGGMARTN